MYISKYIFTYRLRNDQHLIFNSLSGAMDIVEEHICQFLLNEQPSTPSLSNEEQQFLFSRGYLFREAEEEQGLIGRYKDYLDHHSSDEISFVFCPSMTCNLKCVYCFEPQEIRSSNERMTEDQVQAAFLAMDQIMLEHRSPKHHFILFGGEPLLPLNHAIVELILKKAKERGIPGTIISNGMFLSHYQDLLQSYKDMIKIQLTIDGPQAIHDQRRITKASQGTFLKIINQVDWFLDHQFDITIRVNLDSQNIEHLDELLNDFQDRQWNKYPNFSVALSPVENYAGNSAPNLLPNYQITESIKKNVPIEKLRAVNTALNSDLTRLSLPFEKALHTGIATDNYFPNFYFCEAAGGRTFTFSPDHQIYPCTSIIGDKKWSLGTYYPQLQLDEQKLALWNGRHVLNQPECSACNIAFLCSGNCPVQADRKTGSILGTYCGNVKRDLGDHLKLLNSSFVALS
ncbi:radical SAM/SPASM domain-containing protein [Paenibacillus sp. HW567]|uniref:radical SAM/SPASM domain-containing protein n=1 Tax=Paenibacillus sp. HW567 TaxID=1034769 RepID=UPI00037AB3C9|nr:radical SAM protein [Paenibacillus sp. HW567]